MINNKHIPDFEEILPGTILLNDFNGPVSLDEKLLQLQGFFIIQYRNSTITIGETAYKSREINMVEPERPLFQLMGEKTKLEEVLSLQMVKELNINNTKAMEKLRSKTTIESSVSYGSAIILLLLIIGSLTELLRRQKSTEST